MKQLIVRYVLLLVAIIIGVAAFVQFGTVTNITEAEASSGKQCMAGGCSNQLCVDTSQGDVMSTCEWTPAYGCYQKYGTCEKQSDNVCGWTQTPELKQCLENPEREFPLDTGVAE